MKRVKNKDFMKHHQIFIEKEIKTIRDRVILKKYKCEPCGIWTLADEHLQLNTRVICNA